MNSLDIPVGLFVVLHPASVHVLCGLGIDLALEHDRPLEEACAMRDLAAEQVIEEVDRAQRPRRTLGDVELLRSSRESWEPAAYLKAA